MQYFLLRRYVADKNIYNLAVAAAAVAVSLQQEHCGATTAAAAIETEAIKGSALHKKGGHTPFG